MNDNRNKFEKEVESWTEKGKVWHSGQALGVLLCGIRPHMTFFSVEELYYLADISEMTVHQKWRLRQSVIEAACCCV